MGFWDDIGSIASGVGDIASGLSNIFAERENENGTPVIYTVGTVDFSLLNGAVKATNNDPDTDLVLNFSGSSVSWSGGNPVMGTSVTPVLLYAKSGTKPLSEDVTLDMTDYMAGGHLAMCPVNNTPAGGNSIGAAIAFAISAIGIATAINIVNGITAGFTKDPATGSWQFTIQSTGAQLSSATVNLRGADGASARMNMTFGGAGNLADGGLTGSVLVPPGINIDPMIASLEINLVTAPSSKESFLNDIKESMAKAKATSAGR